MTPAERLREAARVLRWRASFATPGPWETFRRGDPDGPFGVTAEESGDIDPDIFDGAPRRGDATYIATMHPGVALALADWLDAEAQDRSHDPSEHDGSPSGYALRVADAVLGRFTEPASLFDMPRTVGSDPIKVIAGSREAAYDISIDIEWVVESGL